MKSTVKLSVSNCWTNYTYETSLRFVNAIDLGKTIPEFTADWPMAGFICVANKIFQMARAFKNQNQN